MIYSKELEGMCTVAKGVRPWTSTNSRRRKMGKSKRN